MFWKYLTAVQSGRAQALFVFLVACIISTGAAPAKEAAASEEPRIVNIYNFIRNSDFRLKNSENVLFDCTQRQIESLKGLNLPATWALQYDALINPRYQNLLKTALGTNDEIAAWWEIPRPLAEKAGIRWRGEHEWDPAANVGFSEGYTPEERRRLVDVYMADFKSIFGGYPRTVGSWFIDEVTLEYMAEKYGVVASCNCKDQIGTDFYTLWGGYWNQAYYPSRLNAYMPAQTRAGQINIPIFRMLGSDPIYQHGTTPGLISLEPVYQPGGGMPQWVDWFMDNLAHQPSLAFAYAQAGQENSFGWEAMKNGFNYQAKLFAGLARDREIRVETLERSGMWFRKHFSVTPATAVVALDDWKGWNRKTVWYNSRYYRLNVLWEKDTFFIRDIHCFDENVVAPMHDSRLTATSLTCETLPIVDLAFWSDSGRQKAGMFSEVLAGDGTATQLQTDGPPVVKEVSPNTLSIEQPLTGGGKFSIVCAQKSISFSGVTRDGKPLVWCWKIIGGDRLKGIIREVKESSVLYGHAGTEYSLKLNSDAGSCRQLDDGGIQLTANEAGKMALRFNVSKNHSLAITNK